jgi:DNA-binding NarL/FixJ family response regulator
MAEKVFVQINNEVIEADAQTLAYIEAWKSDLPQDSYDTEESKLARAAARESALAKLAALGLTEAEIAAL